MGIDTGNTFEEVLPQGLPYPQVPEYMAKGKSYGFHRALQKDEILITADTMVLCEDEIFLKSYRNKETPFLAKLQSWILLPIIVFIGVIGGTIGPWIGSIL